MRGASQSGRTRVTRVALAALLAAHGAAHFVAMAGLVRSISADRPVELFGGLVVTWSAGVAMLLALALAAAGTGFIAAAGMLVGREPKVGPLLVAVAVLSLTTTVLGLWGTAAGVLVDLAVLAVVPGIAQLVPPERSPVA